MILGDVVGWSPSTGNTEKVTYGVLWNRRSAYTHTDGAILLYHSMVQYPTPVMDIGKNRWHVLPRHFLKHGEYKDAEG